MAQNNNKNIGHLLAAKIIIIFHSPLKINAVKINEAAAFRRRSLRSRVASLLSYYFIGGHNYFYGASFFRPPCLYFLRAPFISVILLRRFFVLGRYKNNEK